MLASVMKNPTMIRVTDSLVWTGPQSGGVGSGLTENRGRAGGLVSEEAGWGYTGREDVCREGRRMRGKLIW